MNMDLINHVIDASYNNHKSVINEQNRQLFLAIFVFYRCGTFGTSINGRFGFVSGGK